MSDVRNTYSSTLAWRQLARVMQAYVTRRRVLWLTGLMIFTMLWANAAGVWVLIVWSSYELRLTLDSQFLHPRSRVTPNFGLIHASAFVILGLVCNGCVGLGMLCFKLDQAWAFAMPALVIALAILLPSAFCFAIIPVLLILVLDFLNGLRGIPTVMTHWEMVGVTVACWIVIVWRLHWLTKVTEEDYRYVWERQHGPRIASATDDWLPWFRFGHAWRRRARARLLTTQPMSSNGFWAWYWLWTRPFFNLATVLQWGITVVFTLEMMIQSEVLMWCGWAAVIGLSLLPLGQSPSFGMMSRSLLQRELLLPVDRRRLVLGLHLLQLQCAPITWLVVCITCLVVAACWYSDIEMMQTVGVWSALVGSAMVPVCASVMIALSQEDRSTAMLLVAMTAGAMALLFVIGSEMMPKHVVLWTCMFVGLGVASVAVSCWRWMHVELGCETSSS